MKKTFPLYERIIELSVSNDWETAKKEWVVEQIFYSSNSFGQCICGHSPLKEIIKMHNSLSGNNAIVGNCCIKRFFKIEEYSKVFNSLRKGKVNNFLIEDSLIKGIINSWDYTFITNTLRKKKLSDKQKIVKEKIIQKILKSYSGGLDD